MENSAEYLTPFCTVAGESGEGSWGLGSGGAPVGHSERGEVLWSYELNNSWLFSCVSEYVPCKEDDQE